MRFIYPISLITLLIVISSGCVNNLDLPEGQIISEQVTKDIDTITYTVTVPETTFINGATNQSSHPYHVYTIVGDMFPKEHQFMVTVWRNTKTIEESIKTQSLGKGESDKVKRIEFKGKDAVWEDSSIFQFKSTWIIFPNNCGRYIQFRCKEPHDSTINFCDNIFESLDFECK